MARAGSVDEGFMIHLFFSILIFPSWLREMQPGEAEVVSPLAGQARPDFQ